MSQVIFQAASLNDSGVEAPAIVEVPSANKSGFIEEEIDVEPESSAELNVSTGSNTKQPEELVVKKENSSSQSVSLESSGNDIETVYNSENEPFVEAIDVHKETANSLTNEPVAAEWANDRSQATVNASQQSLGASKSVTFADNDDHMNISAKSDDVFHDTLTELGENENDSDAKIEQHARSVDAGVTPLKQRVNLSLRGSSTPLVPSVETTQQQSVGKLALPPPTSVPRPTSNIFNMFFIYILLII